MGRQKYGKYFFAVLVAAVILGMIYYYGVVHENENKEKGIYSVILYENTANEWNTLMEGINQAEKDFNVHIRYVSMGNARTSEEQVEMVKREVREGTMGILLAAIDSEAVGEGLEAAGISVPVVTVETGIKAGLYHVETHISSNDYEMGKMLGQKIVEDMEKDQGEKTVAVVGEYMERDSVRSRYEGLTEVLENAGIEVVSKARQKGDFSLSLYIKGMMYESDRYIAALDKFTTEEAAKAWEQYGYETDHSRKKYKNPVKIYGIGNTAQTVNDLDNGKIEALVYQNEFNMGYNGIKALVEKEQKGYVQESYSIMHKLVTRDTLYESENERLLFSNQ